MSNTFYRILHKKKKKISYSGIRLQYYRVDNTHDKGRLCLLCHSYFKLDPTKILRIIFKDNFLIYEHINSLKNF